MESQKRIFLFLKKRKKEGVEDSQNIQLKNLIISKTSLISLLFLSSF